MTGKRAYGSGSKRELRPGVWELRAAGRSQRFKGTVKEAERALAGMVASAPGRATPTASTTLGQLIGQWQATRQVEESTAERYDHALAHLPESLLRKQLSKLTLRDFDATYSELARQGMSAQEVRKVHTAVSSALTQALRWRLIEHHPARGAQLPKFQARKVRVPTTAELARLRAALLGDPQGHVWFRLALAAGARRSEVLALRWSDIDLRTGTVTFAESLTRTRARKTTKTDRERSLLLDADTVALLSEWKAAQRRRALELGVGMVRNACVLSNHLDGSVPWAPNSASQRWRRLRERAGVPDVKLHDLRHANASIMLANGVSPAAAAERLGNSQAVILRTYSHVLDEADRAAATAIGQAIA